MATALKVMLIDCGRDALVDPEIFMSLDTHACERAQSPVMAYLTRQARKDACAPRIGLGRHACERAQSPVMAYLTRQARKDGGVPKGFPQE